jgi:lipid-A-disaccharide synthase
MMRTPFVMVYRVSPLTYMMGKPRVKVPYFAMVNLIAGEKIVPELVQDDFTAANVVTHLREILPDGPARERMLEGLVQVKAKLRIGGRGVPPVERAAQMILGMVKDFS